MTRRLILMRHAKSAWDTPGTRDFDRPLNKRGRAGAARVGEWLVAEGHVPDLALVSAAARTQETWARMGQGLRAVPMRAEPALYHASPEEMLAVLRRADADAGRVLMLGHQPGIGVCAAQLLTAAPQDPEFGRYPTAATAVIDFDLEDWAAVGWGRGRLVAFVTPAMLEG